MVVTKIIEKMFMRLRNSLQLLVSLIALMLLLPAQAAVLPDERVDVMEHSYNGGGIQVNGPSILVRKNIGSSVSVSANYYVDMVSSASIDVLASASKYSEQRKEQSVGMDYFHDRTTMSLGYTTSEENDYHAKTYSGAVSQTFFGDLTTLSFGFSLGKDVVGQNDHGIPIDDFHLDKDRRKYSLNLSQILTKDLIAELSLETAADACIGMEEGQSCLNNPYRAYTYNKDGIRGLAAEKYPLTHSTDAIGARLMYHLPYAATLRADFRNFSDSWGVTAKNAELRYTQEIYKDYVVEVKYRIYNQTAADFYSDLFPFIDSQNFKARDKELSPFSSTNFGLGVTYKLPWHVSYIDKSTVNLYWDHMQINYDDFRDYKAQGNFAIGEEPLYSLNADVIRFYLSCWF